MRRVCHVLDRISSRYYTWRKARTSGVVGTDASAWETATLRRHGRRTLQPTSFAPHTTNPTHGQRGAPNLLRDQPKLTAPNQQWASAITLTTKLLKCG